MIFIGQGESLAQVYHSSLNHAEFLARFSDSFVADSPGHDEFRTADSPGQADFWELLRLCRINKETACLVALWGRMYPEMKREFMKKPYPFLKEKVLPMLRYKTALDALYKAVLRAM